MHRKVIRAIAAAVSPRRMGCGNATHAVLRWEEIKMPALSVQEEWLDLLISAEPRIPRKWEWIANECQNRGWRLAAELARRMDNLCIAQGYANNTPVWESVYPPSPDDWKISDVAKAMNFCTPCYKANLARRNNPVYATRCSYCRMPPCFSMACRGEQRTLFEQFCDIIENLEE